MGANMARRLKDCGHQITSVYDINHAAAQELASELGCAAATTLKDAARDAQIIITVVSDDAAMRTIFTGEKDNLLSEGQGKLFINCATVTPQFHVDIEQAAKAVGAASLEACMASSISQAREGSLYLMVGGDQPAFESCRDVLEELSCKLRYIGGAGQAAKVKALVNMVMNINTAGLAEGLGLGNALGLDLQMLCEVFAETGANSRVLQTDADDMLAREHDCWFSASHAAKDSGIANQLAIDAGTEVPLSVATESQYRKMIKLELGELDKSGIAELTFPGRLPK